jgi:hypothetical protein
MRVLNPLTLYTKANLPTFQLIDYNTPKMRTNVQICPIGIEEYAKVEVYLKTGDKKAASEFFKTGIVTCENDGHANCEAIKEPTPKE